LVQHGDHFEADVLLHAQTHFPEHEGDMSDFLHHQAHVLPQLVHGDVATHHRGKARLQSAQVVGHLKHDILAPFFVDS